MIDMHDNTAAEGDTRGRRIVIISAPTPVEQEGPPVGDEVDTAVLFGRAGPTFGGAIIERRSQHHTKNIIVFFHTTGNAVQTFLPHIKAAISSLGWGEPNDVAVVGRTRREAAQQLWPVDEILLPSSAGSGDCLAALVRHQGEYVMKSLGRGLDGALLAGLDDAALDATAEPKYTARHCKKKACQLLLNMLKLLVEGGRVSVQEDEGMVAVPRNGEGRLSLTYSLARLCSSRPEKIWDRQPVCFPLCGNGHLDDGPLVAMPCCQVRFHLRCFIRGQEHRERESTEDDDNNAFGMPMQCEICRVSPLPPQLHIVQGLSVVTQDFPTRGVDAHPEFDGRRGLATFRKLRLEQLAMQNVSGAVAQNDVGGRLPGLIAPDSTEGGERGGNGIRRYVVVACGFITTSCGYIIVAWGYVAAAGQWVHGVASAIVTTSCGYIIVAWGYVAAAGQWVHGVASAIVTTSCGYIIVAWGNVAAAGQWVHGVASAIVTTSCGYIIVAWGYVAAAGQWVHGVASAIPLPWWGSFSVASAPVAVISCLCGTFPFIYSAFAVFAVVAVIGGLIKTIANRDQTIRGLDEEIKVIAGLNDEFDELRKDKTTLRQQRDNARVERDEAIGTIGTVGELLQNAIVRSLNEESVGQQIGDILKKVIPYMNQGDGSAGGDTGQHNAGRNAGQVVVQDGEDGED